jgi:hypothetical protein
MGYSDNIIIDEFIGIWPAIRNESLDRTASAAMAADDKARHREKG